MERVDEQRLLQRAQKGNADAFAQLYRANVQAIYRYIYHRVNDVHLAEDLTGDVFTRALKSMATYRDQGKPFVAWLYRIAHARVIDYYRMTNRRPVESDVEAEPIPVTANMDEGILRRQTAKALREAIGTLTDEQQQVVILRFIEGQSIETVADMMGKNANAIKALQHRALRTLAGRLERAGFDVESISIRSIVNEPRLSPEFDNILAECLDAVLLGNQTIAECLGAYPDYADELKPALQIGLLTARLKSPEMVAEHVDALEMRLRVQMSPAPARPRNISNISRLPMGLSRLAAVIAVIFILALGSGAGLVAASADDLPGDALYGVKRLWEAIVLALVPLTGQPEDLWLHIANSRLDEAISLSEQGRLTEAALIDLYKATYEVSQYPYEGGDASAMIAYFNRAYLAFTNRITVPVGSESVYKDVQDAVAPERIQDGVAIPLTSEAPPSLSSGTVPLATATPPTAAPTYTPVPSDTPSPTPTATDTPSPTATSTPSNTPTPRIPATATRTPTFTPSPTDTPTLTPSPTMTWTPLPLPGYIPPISSADTPVPPGIVPTSVPQNLPTLNATERVRATQQSVYMTQTAGPPPATPTDTP